MKRIIIHWTAGTHKVNNLDREHYHFIIAGDGAVEVGKYPVSANDSTSDGAYAAHTKGCNTGSIGVAVAAMAGATERPFNAGAYPITGQQIEALVNLCARLADQYDIPVTRDAILTHAEVQPTLGIKQAGKWDITWLPGWKASGRPIDVGDILRNAISKRMAAKPVAPIATNETPRARPGFWAWLERLLTGK
jgi:N-acetyl-anhydromuramyl-L-alanine amidase AmpD